MYEGLVYEGLNFSHVKFYHDLSTGFENLLRKPRNFGDNWPLASRYVLTKNASKEMATIASVG